jgi:hypothetical protein
MPCAGAEYTLDPPKPLTYAPCRLDRKPLKPDHKAFCQMPTTVMQADNQTRYLKTDRDQEGAGKDLQCACCGWNGRPLELSRGKVQTAAGEAFSSKVCPSCGRHGQSLER